ncbi:hypothetical protein [Flavobacterium sp.]|uniref:hypothetical protein n=1 Tax=Flavobacterium sp. TaxID=239 RepID=UPI0012112858|nr:hypothetical protein [Flavobacterium sp.]RZJ70297.1 MAG: hypothetical protein EOO49_14295 [Flavobacterium sp.]
MGIELQIFSIYRFSDASHAVLRTLRPEFNNASQVEENASHDRESAQRTQLLKVSGKVENDSDAELLGELQGCPIGEMLYSESGKSKITVFYMETEFGKPWVVMGSAASEAEFLSELEQDEDLSALHPIGKPIKIEALFLTENDI